MPPGRASRRAKLHAYRSAHRCEVVYLYATSIADAEYDAKQGHGVNVPTNIAFERSRRALPRVTIVIALHAPLLFAFVSGNRIIRFATPRASPSVIRGDTFRRPRRYRAAGPGGRVARDSRTQRRYVN